MQGRIQKSGWGGGQNRDFGKEGGGADYRNFEIKKRGLTFYLFPFYLLWYLEKRKCGIAEDVNTSHIVQTKVVLRSTEKVHISNRLE